MTYLPRLAAHPEDWGFLPQGPTRRIGRRAGLGLDEELGALGQTGSGFGFCSASNPQAGCSPVAGVCKPMNNEVLGVFQHIQGLINQLLGKRGLPLIAVDGRIGPATVAALGKVGFALAPGASCDSVAIAAGTVDSVLSAQVRDEGASGYPTRPTTQISPPTVAGPGGIPRHPSDTKIAASAMLDKIFGGMGDNTKIIVGGAVLLGGIFLYKKYRRRGAAAPAAAAPTSNPRRRRRRRR